MPIKIKLISLNILINLVFFTLLIISIQNNQKMKINLILGETILLPISFITGTSFITGSLAGFLMNIKRHKSNS